MRYVALLRGINVGGNSKVEMPRLKTMFEKLGFKNVRTYINSGNVIFDDDNSDAQSLTKMIEQTIFETFGLNVKTTIRDKDNIAMICKSLPVTWNNNAEQKTDILFLWDDVDSKTSLDLIQKDDHVDHLLYVPGAIVWHIERQHYNQSGMNKFIGNPLYKKSTTRNCNTVRKLHSLMSA